MGGVEVFVLERGRDDLGLVASAYDQILRPTFSNDELPDRDAFLEEAVDLTVTVAKLGGEPVGAAVTDHFGGGPVALLTHLAVRSDLRGTGVGSVLMRSLREMWSSGEAQIVLGEVHDPRVWQETAEERPEPRLRFYERSGARLLGVPWLQPSVWKGGERVADMLLLVLGGETPRDTVPASWVMDWTVTYYETCEGSIVAGDRDVERLLRRIGECDPIPVLDISDRDSVALLG